jgi:hypothetical protein
VIRIRASVGAHGAVRVVFVVIEVEWLVQSVQHVGRQNGFQLGLW